MGFRLVAMIRLEFVVVNGEKISGFERDWVAG